MSHNGKSLLAMPAPSRRTMRREGRLPIEGTAKPKPSPQPMCKTGDSVWVVKGELRSPDTGHPLVEPPTIVVDEAYRTKEWAIRKMRAVADAIAMLEIARGKTNPYSPAWLNAVPVVDSDATSIQVTRADSMVLRLFVAEISLR